MPVSKVPQVGDEMDDKTIYAGLSPTTGEALYVMPQDASLTMKWKDAMKYAANLDALGYKDWSLPSTAELNVLFESRNKGTLKGTFNEGDSCVTGWYSSSSEAVDQIDTAWGQRFSDGYKLDFTHNGENSRHAVRCVRRGPPARNCL